MNINTSDLKKFSGFIIKLQSKNLTELEKDQLIYSVIKHLDEIGVIVHEPIPDNFRFSREKISNDIKKYDINELSNSLSCILKNGKYDQQYHDYVFDSDFILNFLERLVSIYNAN